jgi:surface protein
MATAFLGCSNLQISATDMPNLSLVISMARMFSGCKVLTGPTNIDAWNTASVTNMSAVFENASDRELEYCQCYQHEQDVSRCIRI